MKNAAAGLQLDFLTILLSIVFFFSLEGGTIVLNVTILFHYLSLTLHELILGLFFLLTKALSEFKEEHADAVVRGILKALLAGQFLY